MAGQGNNYPEYPDDQNGQDHGAYRNYQVYQPGVEEMIRILKGLGYKIIRPKPDIKPLAGTDDKTSGRPS